MLSAQGVFTKSGLLRSDKHDNGFTLVELLVVISIIAILSVIGIIIFSSAQKSARDARRKQDMQAIAKALEIYKSVNQKYPSGADMGGFTGAISCGSPNANWDAFAAALSPYVQSLPKDPTNTCNWYTTGPAGRGRFYSYHSDGFFYQLSTSLEDVSDGTDNFTYQCACTGCGTTQSSAHLASGVAANCIMLKANGGFGYDSQQ